MCLRYIKFDYYGNILPRTKSKYVWQSFEAQLFDQNVLRAHWLRPRAFIQHRATCISTYHVSAPCCLIICNSQQKLNHPTTHIHTNFHPHKEIMIGERKNGKKYLLINHCSVLPWRAICCSDPTSCWAEIPDIVIQDITEQTLNYCLL